MPLGLPPLSLLKVSGEAFTKGRLGLLTWVVKSTSHVFHSDHFLQRPVQTPGPPPRSPQNMQESSDMAMQCVDWSMLMGSHCTLRLNQLDPTMTPRLFVTGCVIHKVCCSGVYGYAGADRRPFAAASVKHGIVVGEVSLVTLPAARQSEDTQHHDAGSESGSKVHPHSCLAC